MPPVAFVNARPSRWHCTSSPESQSAARDLVDRMPSGGAVINHVAVHCLVPQLPFRRGRRQRYGCLPRQVGLRDTQPPTAVLAKPTKFDLKLMYPPILIVRSG